jgi:hypothetical protein
MKIITTEALVALDGTPFGLPPKSDGLEPEPLTLRYVCVEALERMALGAKLDAMDIMKRHKLAERIYSEAEVDLTGDDVALLVREIAACEMFFPRVKAQALRKVDPALYDRA